MTRILPKTAAPLLALALALLAGCVSDEQVISQANNLHGELEPAVVSQVQNRELAAYVQAVGDRIVEAAEQMHEAGELDGYDTEDWMFQDVQFHLVASPQLNAFTTGGKHVYLYSRLFERSDSEDAFAAVVGHEFGHIVGRHVQDSMNNQLTAGLVAAGLVGGTALLSPEEDRNRNTALAGAAAGGGAALGLSYFSRENERDADALGYRFYVRAGYEPGKFADFFEELIAESGGASGGLGDFFASHPNLQERVAAAKERAADTSPRAVEKYARPPIAGGREFARLHDLSQPLTARAAEQGDPGGTATTAFQRAQRILAAFPSCLAPDDVGEQGYGQ